MEGCPITEDEDYRQSVFKLIPNLKYIDEKDPNGNNESEEENSEEAEGSVEEEDSKQQNSEEDPSGQEQDEGNEFPSNDKIQENLEAGASEEQEEAGYQDHHLNLEERSENFEDQYENYEEIVPGKRDHFEDDHLFDDCFERSPKDEYDSGIVFLNQIEEEVPKKRKKDTD